jgi:chemotaxis family two-component system sensor histidine kinase/response regulator PixL
MMGPPKRILVVDDCPATRSALQRLLEGAGYDVACAADGQEALNQLRRSPVPAAILLDLNMPGLSGWDFRERQLHDQQLGRIPVLLLSGEEGLADTAASLGAAGYFPKPVDVDGLLHALQELR